MALCVYACAPDGRERVVRSADAGGAERPDASPPASRDASPEVLDAAAPAYDLVLVDLARRAPLGDCWANECQGSIDVCRNSDAWTMRAIACSDLGGRR